MVSGWVTSVLRQTSTTCVPVSPYWLSLLGVNVGTGSTKSLLSSRPNKGDCHELRLLYRRSSPTRTGTSVRHCARTAPMLGIGVTTYDFIQQELKDTSRVLLEPSLEVYARCFVPWPTSRGSKGKITGWSPHDSGEPRCSPARRLPHHTARAPSRCAWLSKQR
jgi:hypothetical protein